MGVLAAIMVPHPPLIIPEVGLGQEKTIQKTIDSYETAARELMAARPETIVILSPHSTNYSDYFHISPGDSATGTFSRFGADSVKFKVGYDTGFTEKLCELASSGGISAGTMGEREKRLDHATMVPLYFLNRAYCGNVPCGIVRIGLSGLSLAEHYKLGMLIKKTADLLDRRTAVVASGDLSHVLTEEGPYGYCDEGPVYDRRVMDVMGRGAFGELFEFTDVFCEKAAECGHKSFVIMAGCFDGISVKARKLSYEGPFGVGYGVCTFIPTEENKKRCFLDEYIVEQKKHLEKIKENEDDYVRLARRTVESYILRHRIIEAPADLPEECLNKRAGTFVSLKKDGQLRGCIGTITPTASCIAKEIIRNAISASTEDPRFDPVRPEELDHLVYSVDVLGEAEEIDSPDRLDVKKYGVIVTSGSRRGLLLPNLEGVDTIEEQISIARQKAGIGEKETVKMQRFEVVRHH